MRTKISLTYKVKCCGITRTLRKGQVWRCPRCGSRYSFK